MDLFAGRLFDDAICRQYFLLEELFFPLKGARSPHIYLLARADSDNLDNSFFECAVNIVGVVIY